MSAVHEGAEVHAATERFISLLASKMPTERAGIFYNQVRAVVSAVNLPMDAEYVARRVVEIVAEHEAAARR